jgi:branched-chain amino acid transport system ATP-binding protein
LGSDRPWLETHDLRAGYEGVDILSGLNMNVSQGEFVCLVGPNGAGKSTLLKTVFGLTRVTGGSMLLGGHQVGQPTPVAMLERGVAYVPQGRCNFPLMSVADNLEMAAIRRKDSCAVANDLARLLQRFPLLAANFKRPASFLSGGQQQVLEIGMALLQRPQLLLIDEPSMGLAPLAVQEVFDELLRLRAEGLTILLVEQNTKAAQKVADRIIVMRLGKSIWTGPARSLPEIDLADMFLTGRISPARTTNGEFSDVDKV